MTIYLYVKQHSVTGLKYFGKTTKADPYKYRGSGHHWLRHIKKHGIEFIETIELYEFQDQEEATKFALEFSKKHQIVESPEWANLIVENATDGGSEKGQNLWSEASKLKRSKTYSGCGNPLYGKMRKDLSARNKLPKAWVTNGHEDKLILREDLDSYLQLGYIRSRTQNNNLGVPRKNKR